MTIDELKELGQSCLNDAISDLQRTGSLNAYFVVVASDGLRREVYATLDNAMNDEAFKTALARMIRDRVAKGDVVAVVFVSDVFFARDLNPDSDKVRKAFRMNVEQAAAAGLCTKHEGIIVQVESPIYQQHLTQEYRRDGAKIEMVGSPAIFVAGVTGRVLPSRMAGWFPQVQDAHPS